MSEGYNGYTNYQTWVTALWMDNEPVSNEYLYELANREPVYTSEFTELCEQAEYLEDYVKQMLLDEQPNGLGSDLLQHSIGRIDWREIIKTHTEEKVESI